MIDRKTGWHYKVIELKRVTRVTRGGKRFKVRAIVIAGNKKGKVGIGIEKGIDVSQAVAKAFNSAFKKAIEVPIVEDTIPYEVRGSCGASEVIIKPAKKGRGLVAGSSARVILELAGVKDVSAKILGVTKNPLTNALATIEALKKLNRYKNANQ